MTIEKALTVFTAPTGRRYLDVADLAEICGVGKFALDRTFRPANWAIPRDFRWDGSRVWFAILSLPELADSLEAAGEHDAALKLRERMLPWVEAAIAERHAAGETLDVGTAANSSAVLPSATLQHRGAAPAEQAAAVSTPKGAPAPVEKSFLNRWEEENDK